MATRDLNKVKADMVEFIDRQVLAGFRSPGDIIQSTLDVFIDDGEPNALRPIAEHLTQEAVQAHVQCQSTWPDVTDCDRLDDALAELNRGGITCRQDFSCCGNCGQAEIGWELESERRAWIAVRGYAFYHMQDTEAAIHGHGIYLHYGAVEEGEAAGLLVAHEIVAALQRHGLSTDWNGRLDTRIWVKLEWKRRRPYEVSA